VATVQPVKVQFAPEAMTALEKYVKHNITSLKNGLATLHDTKVNEWRRLYRGTPRDKVRNFPWPNASNVIIQVIGECCDTLRARILGTVYETSPLWKSSLVGDWTAAEEGAEQREAVEEFMNLMGLEPAELDMYRLESNAFDEAIKFGTVMVKFPWEKIVETEAVGDVSGKTMFSDFTKYEGPRPEKIAFEDWAATPTSPTLEQVRFKYHKKKLTKQELEYRSFVGAYDKEKVKMILGKPDYEGETNVTQQKQAINGLSQTVDYDDPKWEIYECWFPYFHNGRTHRIIYSYHLSSSTLLRAVFNWYTKNEEPWELGRLGYTDDGLYGFGFCEMLEHYQEEISTGHNQRVDNRTLANTSVMFAGNNFKLDTGFSLYPACVLPFRPEDVAIEQMGSNYPSSVAEEQLSLELVKARAGIDDGMSGAGGGGSVNKKGAFSAGATFSVMQAGNRRVNINITDMRYLHQRMGRKFLNQYAEFGIGSRAKYFGAKAQYLLKALENIKKGRINLPIRAATASINKELEKQNDMLLVQVLEKHHSGIAQILQGINNPTIPPDLKEYLVGWVGSAGQLMQSVLRNFGHDDTSRLLPELGIVKKLQQQLIDAQKQGANNGQQTASRTSSQERESSGGESSVQQDNSSEEGIHPALAGRASGGDIPNVPEGIM
jgi:hypothetical protein